MTLPAPLFVGRGREMDALLALLRRSTTGPLQAAIIEGAPGIGKSRLLHELHAHARSEQITVLSGSAEELERHRAFAVLFDVLRSELTTDPLAGVVADALFTGSTSQIQATEGGFAATEQFVGWLETRAARGPVLLSLEDLHWADVSSLAAVGTVVRRLSDHPLFVVVTLRPTPRSRELDRLQDRLCSVGALVLKLSELPRDAVAQVTQAVLGAPPGPRLRDQVDDAGGNPLFVLELLRALQQQGVISSSGGTAEIPARLYPADL